MRRILHTMLRVGDMQRAVKFYSEVLGMQLLRTYEQKDENYKLSFIGYGTEEDASVLELTQNIGVTEYIKGTGYGHMAISVDDIYMACEDIKKRGGVITLEPELLTGTNEIIAFIEDPDGYSVELIQHKSRPAETV